MIKIRRDILKIKKMQLSDAGDYTCEDQRGHKAHKMYTVVVVPRAVDSMLSLVVFFFVAGNLWLTCNALPFQKYATKEIFNRIVYDNLIYIGGVLVANHFVIDTFFNLVSIAVSQHLSLCIWSSSQEYLVFLVLVTLFNLYRSFDIKIPVITPDV